MCGSEGRQREALPHMIWQTCMLPRKLIWEEVSPPQYKRMTRKQLGLSQNELVSVKHMRKQHLGKVPYCAITNVL